MHDSDNEDQGVCPVPKNYQSIFPRFVQKRIPDPDPGCKIPNQINPTQRQKDRCGRVMFPEMPYLPWAGPEGDEGPSSFVKRVNASFEYPALFAKGTITKGVPYKDTMGYFTPTETIGKLKYIYQINF